MFTGLHVPPPEFRNNRASAPPKKENCKIFMQHDWSERQLIIFSVKKKSLGPGGLRGGSEYIFLGTWWVTWRGRVYFPYDLVGYLAGQSIFSLGPGGLPGGAEYIFLGTWWVTWRVRVYFPWNLVGYLVGQSILSLLLKSKENGSKLLSPLNNRTSYTQNQCCGSVSGLFGNRTRENTGFGSIIHKRPPQLKNSRYKLSKIQFRPNNFLSLILSVIGCLDLVRKCHTKLFILFNIKNISKY